MKKEIVCPVCGGRGYVSWINSTETSCYSGSKTCPNCNGTRWVEVDMTNADHIRSMTDEKLARVMSGCDCPPSKRGMYCDETRCEACWLEYLKQPYKEAEDEKV